MSDCHPQYVTLESPGCVGVFTYVDPITE